MKINKRSKRNLRGILEIGQPKDLSILDIIPYKSCTPEGILRTRRDYFQRYFRIQSTDIEGLNDQEQLERMNQLTTIMRTFVPSLKLTHMTTPTDLTEQKNSKRSELKQNRLSQTTATGRELKRLRKYERKLVEDIQELSQAEKDLPDLSFFFSIEGETIEALSNQNKQLMRSSGILRLDPLLKDEVTNVLSRINNMTTE